jgi:2-amino-4-hydroxy-6-hydroxymethyldihydropteridine pyrophosphokinase
MYRAYLILGSNLGDRESLLNQAIMELIDRLLPTYLEVGNLNEAVNTSEILETEPWGFDTPNKFLNQSFCCLTELEPQEVLKTCLEIEKELGRERKGPQFNSKGERIYSSRLIDIDILSMEKFIGKNGWRWRWIQKN